MRRASSLCVQPGRQFRTVQIPLCWCSHHSTAAVRKRATPLTRRTAMRCRTTRQLLRENISGGWAFACAEIACITCRRKILAARSHLVAAMHRCWGQAIPRVVLFLRQPRSSQLIPSSVIDGHCCCSNSDVHRRRCARCGGATQFTINAGNPAISASQFDLGVFVGDDWRVGPGLTVNIGLRYEAQNNMHHWTDFSPRLSLAWAPGATAKTKRLNTVLRAGFGVFYDRFALANTITALRYNGIVQQQYVVSNPDFFPTIPSIASLAAFQTTQTVQQISSTLRSPYIIQTAVSLERQLPFNTTLAMTYANAHGVHLLRSQDVNAPLPGTFNPFLLGSGVFPLGKRGPVFLMESSGIYNQNQLITFVNSRLNKDFSLSGSYVLNYARSNTDGLNTFPAKPYDFTGEYGPASTDVRHRVSINGSINTKWNVRFNPFVVVESGPPFDITVGRDLYGTTLFNGRPGIATDFTKPGLIKTKYGLLDPNPTTDQPTLGRNFGR